MLPRHDGAKGIRRGFAAMMAVIGLALAAWTASAAPLPIPIPTLPTLPIPTPTPPPISVPPLPIPTLQLPLPTPTSGVPALPGKPGSGTTVNGLTPPSLSQGSPSGPAGSTGISGGFSGSSPLAPQAVDTSVLGALLGLLGTPANVGVEQPSLQHFSVPTSLASGAFPTGSPGSRARTSPAPAALWPLTITCLLALLAFAIARINRKRLSKLRAVAAAPLMVLVGVISVAAVQTTWYPSAAPTPSAAITVGNTASHSVAPAAGNLSTGSALFDQVMNFEAGIARTEAQLRSLSSDRPVTQLEDEHRLAVTLETTLQDEYAFYAGVARDPAQAADLLAAAATQPAAVKNAVSYDVQAVQAQLAQQAAIAQASQSNTASAAVPSGPLPPGTLAAPSSTLSWPMNGVITQGFGPSPIAIEPAVTLAGITYPHFHTGIDIASALGTPVQAAAPGVVALAGAETDGLGHLVGYGNYVVVAHGNNMITLYGHLDQVLVHPGQAVHAADPIGLEGSTGNSTGPHVHFELRIGGVAADPARYITSR